MNTAAEGPQVHVYCGSTITAGEVTGIIPWAVTHPPVKHGDLLQLAVRAGDIIIIIDGVFYNTAPVRHKEILTLLAQGVTVIGAASMGALRAAELHPYGMIGMGNIFDAYRTGAIEADDEVAVAHDPSDYTPLSEALVDIRTIIDQACRDGALNSSEAAEIITAARAMHFTRRTWTALQKNVESEAPALRAAVVRLQEWREAHPGSECAKHRDARAALASVASGTARDVCPSKLWTASKWQNRYQGHWIARFRGPQLDGDQVPFFAILQFQQLYRVDFPGRWRRHILLRINGLPDDSASDDIELADRALALAESRGFDLANMPADRLGAWLTAEEMASLDEKEKILRTLVRSVPRDASAPIWPTAIEEADDLLSPYADDVKSITAALRRNAEVSALNPRYNTHYLRAEIIRDHLAEQWGLDATGRSQLNAAAMDRGFAHMDHAINVARSFFLWASGNLSAEPASEQLLARGLVPVRPQPYMPDPPPALPGEQEVPFGGHRRDPVHDGMRVTRI
jgi:hypothetical protein